MHIHMSVVSSAPQAAEAAQQLEEDAAAEGWLSVEPQEEGGEARAPPRIREYVQHAYNRLLHSRRLRCASALAPLRQHNISQQHAVARGSLGKEVRKDGPDLRCSSTAYTASQISRNCQTETKTCGRSDLCSICAGWWPQQGR